MSGGLYIDTSALARVLLSQPDGAAIQAAIDSYDKLEASELLRLELRRVARRSGRAAYAERLLVTVALVPLTSEILAAAESAEPFSVGTLDAIHLVTALEAMRSGRLDSILTFDHRLAEAAVENGLTVVAPTV